MFVDKKFKVRGYQKTDFILSLTPKEEKKEDLDVLFDNLILDGNTVTWFPKHLRDTPKEMTDQEIYNEFKELIPDNSQDFAIYIKNDPNRPKPIF